MNDSFILVLLGIAGVVLIVAGILVYRRGKGTRSKAFGIISIAVGAVLLFYTVLGTPVTSRTGPAQGGLQGSGWVVSANR